MPKHKIRQILLNSLGSKHSLMPNHKTRHILLNILGSKQSINELRPVYVILQEKKFHQKILQKPWPEN